MLTLLVVQLELLIKKAAPQNAAHQLIDYVPEPYGKAIADYTNQE
jgi:hypothetical protein